MWGETMPGDRIADASIVGNRIVVWSKEGSAALYKSGFFGKTVNISKPKEEDGVAAYLELSFLEALYLLEGRRIGLTRAGRPVSAKSLLPMARKNIRLFDELYTVYKDLRGKGYVVRPAMKFGADFAVYQYGPGIDHAPFIVHVIPGSQSIDPVEMVRAGRLSHTVRKKFILATIDEAQKKVLYFMFVWWKA
jgi:tRNA-intron endonuclease